MAPPFFEARKGGAFGILGGLMSLGDRSEVVAWATFSC